MFSFPTIDEVEVDHRRNSCLGRKSLAIQNHGNRWQPYLDGPCRDQSGSVAFGVAMAVQDSSKCFVSTARKTCGSCGPSGSLIGPLQMGHWGSDMHNRGPATSNNWVCPGVTMFDFVEHADCHRSTIFGAKRRHPKSFGRRSVLVHTLLSMT